MPFSNQRDQGTLPPNSVQDTEIDWGNNQFQVDLDDMPDGATYGRVTNSLITDLGTLTDGSNADSLHTHDLATLTISVKRITDTDSPYNILGTDQVIFADTDGGAITVNLPAGTNGEHFKIINTGSSGNNVTVDPNGTEQLFGGGAGTSLDLIDAEIIDIHYQSTEGWW